MTVTLLDLVLIAAVAFALWGTVRSFSQPQLHKTLSLELARKTQELEIALVELDRERWLRRSIEDHYQLCKTAMISQGLDVNLPKSPVVALKIDKQVSNYIVDILSVYFTVDELREVTFQLGIPFDDIKHTTLKTTAVELAWYMERRQRFDDLVHIVDKHRPALNIQAHVNELQRKL